MKTALKEWAILIDAFARGEIILTLRKGGIREQRAAFSVRHDRFLLYPTFFHEKAAELDARFHGRLDQVERPPEDVIPFEFVAEVAGLWRIDDLSVLERIQPMQGLTLAALESRFHYRNKPGVQAIALRISRLTRRVLVPETRRYLGCVSWVNLDADLDVSEAVPVLQLDEFKTRLAAIAALLGSPD